MNTKLKIYSLALIVAVLSISVILIYPNFPKQCQFYVRLYLEKASSLFCNSEKDEIPREKLFTADELQKYDGSTESLGLYVALLGKVYDVEKGAQHYKPGGGYAFFSGKDASKAYVTGEFTEEGLTDDISGLDDEAISGLVQWQGFYDKEYVYVGKVVGRYYDSKGNPTEEIQKVEEAIERAKVAKEQSLKEIQLFPPCNSEWEHGKGGRVWCTENSGGVERTWKGVPRKFFKPGDTSPRCVCVRTTGPPSLPIHGITDGGHGDLDNPNVKEYDDCPAHAESCNVQ